ncbi:Nicotinate phosphoribosyltransferase [Strongyloides ratti]|uniref:Nicotinate phosphoribosyltransferase n=1 Tax=Strongyloides ratti TaxID=34506 RepID=A0A090KRM0_STRRB|nr:Nicotinate phosphoribosyltransferase [Strongyloides ratti]CEF60035.1 Nicotinate phosphoribosyltransferase [Strongyloides ratti]
MSKDLQSIGQDNICQPLLTDYYQITMTYAYWKANCHEESAVFDLFFRKNPFQGEYTVFAGLEDVIKFVSNFKFSESDLNFLRKIMPQTTEVEFFDYLASLNCNSLKITAIPEGSVTFPKVPLITVEGPLAICQLLETSLLNLVNYASLVATNAARFRHVAGNNVELLEFGLRRAQGPNGGLSASKYCFIGGFDGTSNVLAAKLFGIPAKGTQAHSFICSFNSEKDLKYRNLRSKDGSMEVDILNLCKEKIQFLYEIMSWPVDREEISQSELIAFCSYAVAFPDSFLALIDTYDVLRSGVINFLAVTLALSDLGYQTLGCRIDSGDLCYLSTELRSIFNKIKLAVPKYAKFVDNLKIVASNDIKEETIQSFNEQGHEINSFGVGTHLVTCQKQPALGCVYKLVAVGDVPKIKLSQEVAKISIPGKKNCYRIYGKSNYSILDLMTLENEEPPQPGKQILCRHPFEEGKRAIVIPSKVEKLQEVYWDHGKVTHYMPTLKEIKQNLALSMKSIRKDHCRFVNPTPYKVSVSEKLYEFLHEIWLQNAPVGKLE